MLTPHLHFSLNFPNYRRSNREIINVPQQLFSAGASSLASTVGAVPATTVAVRNRKAHGVLMTINFMLVMPLGALAARQLRCHWLKNPVIRGALFYVHIATQVGSAEDRQNVCVGAAACCYVLYRVLCCTLHGCCSSCMHNAGRPPAHGSCLIQMFSAIPPCCGLLFLSANCMYLTTKKRQEAAPVLLMVMAGV